MGRGRYATDLSGEGARLFGNRWNNPGTAILYTAESRALALVEVWATSGGDLLGADFMMLELELPDTPSLYTATKTLPADWNALPAQPATRLVGDAFVREGRFLGLWVPSVVVPAERNLLLNPNHEVMKEVRIRSAEAFPVDPRLAAVRKA